MIRMVKCPVCGMDVSPEEYGAHYDSHGRGAEWERFSPERLSREQVLSLKPLSELRRSVYAAELRQVLRADEKGLVGKFLEERARFWEDRAKYEPASAVRQENIINYSSRISELAGIADVLGLDKVYNDIGVIAQIVANLRLV